MTKNSRQVSALSALNPLKTLFSPFRKAMDPETKPDTQEEKPCSDCHRPQTQRVEDSDEEDSKVKEEFCNDVVWR